jgi:uncharacterized protein
MRLLFVCDLHGSNLVFYKIIKAISDYNVDLLVISGDLAGKDIRAIIEDNGNYMVEYNGTNKTLTKNEIIILENKLSDTGHYFFYSSFKELERLDKKDIFIILDNKILERIELWMDKILKKVNLNKTDVIFSTGNDDIFAIDELIRTYENKGIYYGNNKNIDIKDFKLISFDYTNISPWKTLRESSEDNLEKMIEDKIRNITYFNNVVFNFHCPPYNTQLDIAPEIDKNFQFIVNPIKGINKIHVGSKAVLKTIKNFQPLLSLHGHIHESQGFNYIGKTLSLNPGSEYSKGIMHAYIIDINKENQIINFNLIEE